MIEEGEIGVRKLPLRKMKTKKKKKREDDSGIALLIALSQKWNLCRCRQCSEDCKYNQHSVNVDFNVYYMLSFLGLTLCLHLHGAVKTILLKS